MAVGGCLRARPVVVVLVVVFFLIQCMKETVRNRSKRALSSLCLLDNFAENYESSKCIFTSCLRCSRFNFSFNSNSNVEFVFGQLARVQVAPFRGSTLVSDTEQALEEEERKVVINWGPKVFLLC